MHARADRRPSPFLAATRPATPTATPAKDLAETRPATRPTKLTARLDATLAVTLAIALTGCADREPDGGEASQDGAAAAAAALPGSLADAREGSRGGAAAPSIYAEALALTPLPDPPGPGAPPATLAAAQVAVPEGWPAWADPATCVECHEDQAYLHARSHHGRAMELASDETVLGDFDDASFELGGSTTRFVRRGGRFFVQTDDLVGERAELELLYTFGVHPLQQYLVAAPGGRLQPLQLAWDVVQRRWFHLQGETPPPPGDAYHWSGRGQNANAMCIECHTTAFVKGYDPPTDAYASTWLELGVGCQSCHGPGSEHLAWVAAGADGAAEADGSAGAGGALAGDPDVWPEDDLSAGFVVDPNGPEQVAVCARCHSRRRHVSDDPRRAASYLDAYSPSLLREGLYHPDGQILDEVFVYGSFAQSRMHAAGVKCGDCHEPHGLSLRVAGNGLCTQCHNDVRSDPRFPTLKPGDYDTPAHHHHGGVAGEGDGGASGDAPAAASGDGSACVDCHMPASTYMVVDPRRDHGFRVPRPDLSLALGVPDVCTGCHTDQQSAWAAARVVEWATERGEASQVGQPHFASVLAAARSGEVDPGLGQALVALVLDQEARPIVRATAMEHLADRGDASDGLLTTLATDDEPLVRAAAASALDVLPPVRAAALAGRLMLDPLRAVRSGASLSAGPLPRGHFDSDELAHVEPVVREHLAAERSLSDLPDGAFRLGLFAVRAGQLAEAEEAWARALAYDPLFLPARFNLVHLLDGQGRADEAEALLREGLILSPEEGELHYSLGLLLAQEQRLDDALPPLRSAFELLTEHPRAAFNYGLLLLQLERPDEAELALREAVARDPQGLDAWGALLDLALARGDDGVALSRARTLRRLLPGPAPELDGLIAELEAGRGR